jgi:aspartate/methionine/tyrosine aminotransferase
VRRLKAIPGLACEPPEGAFYVYVSCAGWLGKRTPQGKTLENDGDVTTWLLEQAPRAAEWRGLRLVAVFPRLVCRGAGAPRTCV